MLSPQIKSAINRLRYSYLLLLPPRSNSICRVLHDKECSRPRGGAQYAYLSRFYNPKDEQIRGLPETVRFNGGRGTVILAPWWQRYLDQWNSPVAQKYLKRLQSGYVNYGPYPKIEQLCTASPGGTFVVVRRVAGNRAYIECYQNDKRPSDYIHDYRQLFGVAYSDDSIGYPPCGFAFTIAIKNPGENLWVDIRDLSFVRSL